jgi:hypothetical protein
MQEGEHVVAFGDPRAEGKGLARPGNLGKTDRTAIVTAMVQATQMARGD